MLENTCFDGHKGQQPQLSSHAISFYWTAESDAVQNSYLKSDTGKSFPSTLEIVFNHSSLSYYINKLNS
jgi:hypothetical protein